jgi:hypothetical protein
MRHLTLPVVALLASLATYPSLASDLFAPPPAQAPVQAPGKEYYPEHLDYTCQIVTEQRPIKKTVYECREVPFCLHCLPKFGHCDCCPQCQECPRYKRVLIKREIIVGYECVTKCVPEALPPCGSLKEVPPVPAPLPVAADYFRGAIPPPPAPAGRP